MDELRTAQKQISELKSVAAQAQSQTLITQAKTITGGAQLLAAEVADMDAKSLQVRQLFKTSHRTHALMSQFMEVMHKLGDCCVMRCTHKWVQTIEGHELFFAGKRCTTVGQAR